MEESYTISRDSRSSESVNRIINKMGNYKMERNEEKGTFVEVAGIKLPIYNEKNQRKDGILVDVPSTLSNLRSLSLSIVAGKPALLQGPVGCGKTSLVEHLALITGQYSPTSFIRIQLGDQTDSKVLIGSYRCTDIPGEFVWQPGSLTQAVLNGSWLLIEDIDYAPMDVLSVLASLLETRTLILPGNKVVKAAPRFQLFVTQRLVGGLPEYSRQAQISILDKHWNKINVEPMSKNELQCLITTKWPNLQRIVEKILQIYFSLSSGRHDISLGTNVGDFDDKIEEFRSFCSRLNSTRDLMKWCGRINKFFEARAENVETMIYQEALDCFCACIPDANKRFQVAYAIAEKFNVPKQAAEFYCKTNKPAIYSYDKSFSIGRASLDVRSALKFDEVSRKFAFMRQSVSLLERIAVSVQNNEPVLLVGETGTGKTSTVQYLAQKTGRNLVVLNMNQQSDSADLLGGYKPVSWEYPVDALRKEFDTLFRLTYEKVLEENASFLKHLANCRMRKDWKDLLSLMLVPANKAIQKLSKSKRVEDEVRLLRWTEIYGKIRDLRIQLQKQRYELLFYFIEGSLIRALQNGDWILLDEINLASVETLECLSGLLEKRSESIILSERGSFISLVIQNQLFDTPIFGYLLA